MPNYKNTILWNVTWWSRNLCVDHLQTLKTQWNWRSIATYMTYSAGGNGCHHTPAIFVLKHTGTNYLPAGQKATSFCHAMEFYSFTVSLQGKVHITYHKSVDATHTCIYDYRATGLQATMHKESLEICQLAELAYQLPIVISYKQFTVWWIRICHDEQTFRTGIRRNVFKDLMLYDVLYVLALARFSYGIKFAAQWAWPLAKRKGWLVGHPRPIQLIPITTISGDYK